jgi:hypothetical protein
MNPSNDNRERIVIIEDGADLTPDVVVRETVPPVPERMTGPDRGAYEDSVVVMPSRGWGKMAARRRRAA